MGKKYYRSQGMQTGSGFKCFNCGRLLAAHLTGSVFTVVWTCERCSAEITVRCPDPIPFAERALDEIGASQERMGHEVGGKQHG